jgi:hypothetical protein
MKRRSVLILTLILTLCFSMMLTSCEENPCAHVFDNACDKECELCGYERITSHTWKEATCFAPETCRNCGLEVGEALGHKVSRDIERSAEIQNCRRCNVYVLPDGSTRDFHK